MDGVSGRKKMTPRDFCYWLRGYFELNDASSARNPKEQEELSNIQIGEIKRHLDLVFNNEKLLTDARPMEQTETGLVWWNPDVPMSC